MIWQSSSSSRTLIILWAWLKVCESGRLGSSSTPADKKAICFGGHFPLHSTAWSTVSILTLSKYSMIVPAYRACVLRRIFSISPYPHYADGAGHATNLESSWLYVDECSNQLSQVRREIKLSLFSRSCSIVVELTMCSSTQMVYDPGIEQGASCKTRMNERKGCRITGVDIWTQFA
jgi:hypothetical protein